MSGAWIAVWPLVRHDLTLSYVQVGVLLSAPAVFANLIEPAFGILGDRGHRRAIVRGGGVAFAAALVLMAASPGFWTLLLALAVLYPATGAFVGLSQASYMDAEPERREQNMARWVVAGYAGALAGPLLVGALARGGMGWRSVAAVLAVVATLLLLLVWSLPSAAPHMDDGPPERPTLRGTLAALASGARDLRDALRRRAVVRWLVLLEMADLMVDVLLAYVALYLVDVAGAGPAVASVAVAVYMGLGLAGSAALVPLLERVSGARYVRASAAAALVVFPLFLIVPSTTAKVALLGLIGLLTTGWYAVLKGRLYGEMEGRSATVLALANVANLVATALPFAIGIVAERVGLGAAMWVILLAPVALLVGMRGEGRVAGRRAEG